MKDSRPRVLAILPAFIPSTLISIVKPLIQLHRTGLISARITLESLVNLRTIGWADLVVFSRNSEPRYGYLPDLLLGRNIPFVYDLDDNFFELPFEHQNGTPSFSSEQRAMLIHYLKSASFVRLYSEPLLEKIKSLNPKAEKVSGSIDLSLISFPPAHLDGRKVKLVYSTSRFPDELSSLFIPALIRILNDYPEQVEVHFWGYISPSLRNHPKIHQHGLILDYDRFLRRFSRAGFDIGLAPLKDDIFHRSKTNNKFREYGACRIAGIYSNVDVYSACATDGETGLLVSNEPESWYEAIARLIEDLGLREKIKAKALEFVRRHYSQEDSEKVWLNQIQRVLAEKDRASNQPVGGPVPVQENIGLRASNKESKKESSLEFFIKKIHKLAGHLRRNEFQMTFWLLRRSFYNHWMVLKLRWLTWTSYIFNRRRI